MNSLLTEKEIEIFKIYYEIFEDEDFDSASNIDSQDSENFDNYINKNTNNNKPQVSLSKNDMNNDISNASNKANINNINNKSVNKNFENSNPDLINDHFDIEIDLKKKEKNEIISKSKLFIGFIDIKKYFYLKMRIILFILDVKNIENMKGIEKLWKIL